MSLKNLVEKIDKLYKEEPGTAKEIVKQEIADELLLQILDEKLTLLREISDGLRLIIQHHKNRIKDHTGSNNGSSN